LFFGNDDGYKPVIGSIRERRMINVESYEAL